jgi:hypothetical protein
MYLGNLTFPAGEEAFIPVGSGLGIGHDAILTNAGLIVNSGSLSISGTLDNAATITNNYALTNYGKLKNEGLLTSTGTVTNNQRFENSGAFVDRNWFVNNYQFLNTGTYYHEWNSSAEGYIIPADANNKITFVDDPAKTLTWDLLINGTFMIWGGGSLLTDSHMIINNNTLSVSGGALSVTGSLYNNARLTVTGDELVNGILTNNGYLLNSGTLSTSSSLINNSTLINNGTVSNAITLDNYGSFTNNNLLVNAGTLVNKSTGTLDNSGTFANQSVFINQGYFYNRSTYSGTLNNQNFAYDKFDFTTDGYTVPNNGITYYIDFTKTLTADLTVNGILEIWTGGTLNTSSFNIFNNNTCTIRGGTLNVQALATLINGYASGLSSASFNVVSGTCNLLYSGMLLNGQAIPGNINVSGGTLLQSGGTLYNGNNSSGTVNVTAGTVNLTGGDFVNGQVSTGTINITGGTFQSGSLFYNGSGATGTVLVNGGTLNLADGVISNGYGFGKTGNVTVLSGTLGLAHADIEIGIGTSNISIFGTTMGDWWVPGAMTIPSSAFFVVPIGSSFIVDTNGNLIIQGTVFNRGTLTKSGGTIINNGLFVDRWDPAVEGYTIPYDSDGRRYCVDSSVAMTNDLTVNGTLLVWSTLSTGTYTLYNEGTLTVSGGLVNVVGLLQNDRLLTVSYGTLQVTGSLVNNSILTNSWILDNWGTFTNLALLINDSGFSNEGTFSNNGVFSNNLSFTNNNWFFNEATFNNVGNFTNLGSFVQDSLGTPGGTFVTTGRFYRLWSRTSPVGTDAYGAYYYLKNPLVLAADLTINGTLEMWPGTSLTTGAHTIFNEGTLTVSLGTLEISAGGNLRNDSLLTLSSGVLNNLGGLTNYGTMNNLFGTFNNSTTFTNYLYFTNAATCNNYGIMYDRGLFVNTGTLNRDGGRIFSWWNPAVTYVIRDIGDSYFMDFAKTVTADLTINGTLEVWAGATLGNNDKTIYNNGTLLVNGGTFNHLGGTIYNHNLQVTSGAITFNNNTILYGTKSLFGAYVDDVVTGSLIVPYGQTMSIPGGSSLTIGNEASLFSDGSISGALTNNGLMVILPRSQRPVVTNLGTLVDLSPQVVTIPMLTIPPRVEFVVPQDHRINVMELINTSSHSIDIYGSMYTYSLLLNGDVNNPGTINLYYPGALTLLSGTLQNGNSNSAINVYSGGTLHNYYGIVDATLGSLHVLNGGTFDNVRGNVAAAVVDDGGKIFDAPGVMLDRDLDIDETWTITQDASIKGHQINVWGNLVVDRALALEDVTVNNVTGTNIRCADDTASLSVNNVVWNQVGTYSFTHGSITVTNDWLIQGQTFSYASLLSSTISENSTLHVVDAIFAVASPFKFVDATSAVCLNNATLRVDNPMLLSTGRLRSQNDSVLDLRASVTLGDNFALEIEGDSILTVTRGNLLYNNIAQDKITFMNEAATLYIGSGLTACKNVLLSNGTLQLSGTLVANDAAIMQQDMTNVLDALSYKTTQTLHAGVHTLDNGYVQADAGVFTDDVRVRGNSSITGVGVMGAVTLEDASASCSVGLLTGCHTITLNGGTLTLVESLKFTGDNTLSGSGKVVLHKNKVVFGTTDQAATSTIYWDMSSQVELNAKWLFRERGPLVGLAS